MRHRGVLTVVACALLLTSCAGTVRSGVATLGAPTSSPVPRAELLQRQERLGVVARAIQDLVDPLEGPVAKPLPSGENRYGEVRIDSERDRVELWWSGPLPVEVQEVLANHPEVVTEVHEARFTDNELHEAAERIVRFLRSGRLGEDVTTDAIRKDVRAGRLEVHVIDPARRYTEAALHERLDPLSAVPLDIVQQRGPTLGGLVAVNR